MNYYVQIWSDKQVTTYKSEENSNAWNKVHAYKMYQTDVHKKENKYFVKNIVDWCSFDVTNKIYNTIL